MINVKGDPGRIVAHIFHSNAETGKIQYKDVGITRLYTHFSYVGYA